jgi:hypothetical protein
MAAEAPVTNEKVLFHWINLLLTNQARKQGTVLGSCLI